MFSEHERTGNVAIRTYFKVFSLHLSGGTEEQKKSLKKVGVQAG
jgi:hypothetical protein